MSEENFDKSKKIFYFIIFDEMKINKQMQKK